MLPIETDGAEILVDPPLARRVAERHSGADGCHRDEPVGFAAGDQVGLVEAVCLIRRRRPDAGRAGWSAMAKGPVPRAQVGALGLVGDRQADRDHHGGPDKAVYAMDAAEVDHWLAVMPGLQVGGMGENLTIRSAAGSQTGIDDLELGARLWVGPAETFPGASRPWQGTCGLVLRVTGVRNPCPTFARGMGRGDWIQVFSARNRVGVYFAVEAEGTVTAGSEVRVWTTPGHGVSCRRWFAHHDPRDAQALLAAESAGRMVLAGFTRAYVVAAAEQDSG